MKCYVTGASGFVGPHLVESLKARGARVGGTADTPDEAGCPGRFSDIDLLDFETLSRSLKEFLPDTVFHLAALSDPAHSRRKPRDYLVNNLTSTVNLLESVRLFAAQAKIILVSSSAVYASSDEFLNEESPTSPASPYAGSKLLCEEIGGLYFRHYGSRIVTVRPFNHAGPGQTGPFVIADFCRQIAEREREREREGPGSIRVGCLDAVCDFLDVRDVVQAYAILAERGVEGQIYNLCSGQGTSIDGVLRTALSFSETAIQAVPVTEKEGASRPTRTVGDGGKIRALGWSPGFTLRETIQDSLDFWRRRLEQEGRSSEGSTGRSVRS